MRLKIVYDKLQITRQILIILFNYSVAVLPFSSQDIIAALLNTLTSLFVKHYVVNLERWIYLFKTDSEIRKPSETLFTF